ncbi:hypothetical protein GCM10022246_33700 [Pedobacter ginsengiterrae]|uniref:Uncharacterized protein n=1 Tax=Pedobacter ginsengiterrae TaxID=871696 RepID=A0ABP7Q9K2_9SPHI
MKSEAFLLYILGIFFVVSGTFVFIVSGGVVFLVVSAIGVVVESIFVLSEEPAIFLDELHADAAIINEPAKARLKIIFFIVFIVISIVNNLVVIWFYFFDLRLQF